MASVHNSPPAGNALAVLLLAVSAFIIVTTEFIIVGLLPGLARDLGVTVATAGWLVTLFGFTVMLFGPLLTGLVSHLDRKALFVVILLVFAGSNGLAAAAPNIGVLALARFLPAIALPVFWGTASETAGMIAGPGRESRAVSNVYMGIAGAMVLGIPLGTLAGDMFGWRARHVRRACCIVANDGGPARGCHATNRPATPHADSRTTRHLPQARLRRQPRSVGPSLHGHVHGLYLSG